MLQIKLYLLFNCFRLGFFSPPITSDCVFYSFIFILMVSKVREVFLLYSARYKYNLLSSVFSHPLPSFPTLLLFQDVQIVSTDENQVFLALQEWYQSDTYNLYQSDPQGVYYSIVLENVRSTKQPEENVLIDILEVRNVLLGEEFVILNSLCDITMGEV